MPNLFLNEIWTILIFRCLFQVIKSNKPSKILFFFKLKVFWWNEAVEVIEATEVVEAVEVNRPLRFLMPGRSLNIQMQKWIKKLKTLKTEIENSLHLVQSNCFYQTKRFFVFNIFGYFYAFLVRMTACSLPIKVISLALRT